MSAWSPEDEHLLVELMRLDTVTPLETGRPSALADGLRRMAEHAALAGFEVAHLAPPPPEALARPDVPLTVRACAEAMGDEFLSSQPNLVLRLGPERDRDRCLVFNAHLDTVSGDVPVVVRGGRLHGRGAVDAKGPAVAALAGVRAAVEAFPDLTDRVSVLMQLVGGEEGGAMGVYGTREVVELGFRGRLNVVAEPTRLGYFDHGTTSMTASVTVEGVGSTDDEPDRGDNATLILSTIACTLAECLSAPVDALGAKMCVAGIHTGTAHNRVFGNGRLLLNFAYRSLADAERIERLVDEAFAASLSVCRERLGGLSVGRRSAARVDETCSLQWLKRGLPVLANRDAEMERVLERAGLARHDPAGEPSPFTCDAMWMQEPGTYAIVCGPGDLGANGAHAEHEYVERSDLAAYAETVAAVVSSFADEAVT